MPFGSVFSRFLEFNAVTADDKVIRINNTLLTRWGFKILGVPHIGIRLRSRKIIKNAKDNIENMLDAGCGTGVYSFFFSNKAKNIEAIDISKEKIDYLNKENIFNNINFSVSDLTKLGFSDNIFDFIVCSDVLEHIKNDRMAIEELSRVLKKDGYLLITVPYDSKNNKNNYRKYNHERAGYTLKKFKDLISKTDFKIVLVEGYSYNLTDKISNMSYRFIENKILLALFFYPLYLASIIIDSLKLGDPNGLFIKLIKN